MFGGYIYSYAVKGTVNMTSDQGAYLTSMYWVCISIMAWFLFHYALPSGSDKDMQVGFIVPWILLKSIKILTLQ